MIASAQIPQFTLESDARLGALGQARASKNGPRFSYTDVLVAASTRALSRHPTVNSSFAGDAIVEHSEINIAFAVALAGGLIAPVIRGADGLTMSQLSTERARLSEAARTGSLIPEEVLSATFTISNLGSFGIRRFRALVVPPQAAILAVGAATDDGLLSLSLSCDHRVLDGAPAAEFLVDIVTQLEKPDWVFELL